MGRRHAKEGQPGGCCVKTGAAVSKAGQKSKTIYSGFRVDDTNPKMSYIYMGVLQNHLLEIVPSTLKNVTVQSHPLKCPMISKESTGLCVPSLAATCFNGH